MANKLECFGGVYVVWGTHCDSDTMPTPNEVNGTGRWMKGVSIGFPGISWMPPLFFSVGGFRFSLSCYMWS